MDDLNAEARSHFGRVDANTRGTLKHGARAAFLDPCLPNVTLIIGTGGLRLKPRVRPAVELADGHVIEAASEIMLDCGAVATKALLRNCSGPENALRSRAEAERMRIADASTMPRIPSAALHFSTITIAAYAGRFIDADHSRIAR
ncbi:hypothetical protein GCM10011415_26530 [Salipiger pallidus]|uniref:Uncharacterized protein n=1 Tax=Salipiger pallidus TaxID=1775170 RepID=A0A8J3EH71_9RHOB|nr:hypothetical protein [Salipiger pallidus]GGG76493.1 hypothetical protein GCM10011415_26530 [Salipiger pallidus]